MDYASMLTKGQELLRMGDDYQNQGDFDNSAKNYKLDPEIYPNEAAGKLKLIPLHRATSESSTSTSHSLPDQPRVKMMDKIRAFFKSSSHNAFDDAKDTNTIVTSFIEADDETKNILRCQIYDIIAQFKDNLATLETARELVTLARIPDRDIFVHIIEKLLEITKNSSLVPTIALQGLAVAINSCPDGIDMRGMQGDYSDILWPLKQRLEIVRSDRNEGQLTPLLHALAALLNAMVCSGVHALNRKGTFDPLKNLLDKLKGHRNPTVQFLALYAKQGLAYVGNGESLGMGIYRRGRLAIAVAVDIADGISNVNLGKFASTYNNIMEVGDFTMCAKWYQGLIYVDCTLALQDWSRFEKFVLESKLKSDEYFLQGICLRLEQVAVTQSVEVIRDGAIDFLRFLSKNPLRKVRQAAMTVIERLVSSDCIKHNNASTKHHAKAIKCTCSAYQANHFGLTPVWDLSWHTTSSGILLQAVQQRKRNNKSMDEIPARFDTIRETVEPNASDIRIAAETGDSNVQACVDILVENMTSKSSLNEVRAALESYYRSSLVIQRVSGDKLDLNQYYINLTVVEA
ncbi:hypothetical protein BGX21_010882 [Mortierella sp. AD011]|nr:hypothetical protein BGX21_010882 [Mortierella sp. AD011]